MYVWQIETDDPSALALYACEKSMKGEPIFIEGREPLDRLVGGDYVPAFHSRYYVAITIPTMAAGAVTVYIRKPRHDGEPATVVARQESVPCAPAHVPYEPGEELARWAMAT